MLVVTPKPQIHESLIGYLLHLTEANGYPSTSYIRTALDGRWYSSSVGRLNAEPLADLVGLTASEVARLSMRPSERSRGFVRVFGHDLPSYDVSKNKPKVCPLCLAGGSRCEAFWDLSQAAACPIHGVRLRTICPDCGKPLSWTRKKVKECRCGSDLTAWPTETASGPLRDLMEVMRHIMYRTESETSPPDSMSHLAHLSLRDLGKLLWVMCNLIRGEGSKRKRSKTRSNYRRELDQVAEILSNWPVNFQGFIEARYDALVSDATPLPGFDVHFDWLSERLIKNVEGGQRAFRFMQQEAFRFGVKHWTRSAMCRSGKAGEWPSALFRWGTMGEACEVLGVHMLTLKRGIRSGEIPTKKITGKARRSIAVDLDWARSQLPSKHPAISCRDAAKVVGVSIETLRALCVSGVYEQKYRPSFPGSLTLEDVKSLAQRLANLGKGKRHLRTTQVVSLDRAFVLFNASPSERAAIYQWLLRNPNRVRGRKADGSGAGRIQVETTLVESLLMQSRDQDSCTVPFAAKQLACTPAVVRALRGVGLLEWTRVQGRVRPRKASLARFANEYEGIAEVARRVGVGVKMAYSRVDLADVRHIRLKATQYNTVFVHRADVSRVEASLKQLLLA